MPSSANTPLRGLALPILRSGGGYFTPKNRFDVAWGDLLLTLFTPIGSRPMRRQFGCALTNILFEPNEPSVAALAESTIRQAAARFTPHLVIEDVRILFEQKVIRVGVVFSLVEDRTTVERFVTVSKSDIINLVAAARNQ